MPFQPEERARIETIELMLSEVSGSLVAIFGVLTHIVRDFDVSWEKREPLYNELEQLSERIGLLLDEHAKLGRGDNA